MQTDHELLGPLQEYDDVVPLDAARLVTRARRAQRRRRVGALAVATVTVAAGLMIGPLGLTREEATVVASSSVQTAPGAQDPALTPSVRAQLIEAADATATGQEGVARRIEVVQSTTQAESALHGAWVSDDYPVWVIQIEGHFTCHRCAAPGGPPAMMGRYATILLRTEDLSPAGFMFGREHTDLTPLGHVTVLRPE